MGRFASVAMTVDQLEPFIVPDARVYHTRWIYFWLFAWLQCSGRFMSLYYESEGLTDAEIGVVFAVGTVSSAVLGPCISTLADSLGTKHGPAARLVCFVAIILFNSVAFALMGIRWAGISRFWVMLVYRIVDMSSVACSLADAITISSVPDRTRYGNERVFGAWSWAIMGVFLGALMEHFEQRVVNVVQPFTAVGICLAVVFAGVPPRKPRANDRGLVRTDVKGVMLLFKSYLSSVSKVTFFLFAVTLAMGMVLVEKLIFLYFRELNASFLVCGLSVVVTVVFEIPLFSYSQKLLKKIGTNGCITLCSVAYIVRVIGYTLVRRGAWVLLFEPLHGVTIALSSTACVEVMASITPPDLAATGQMFLNSVRSLLGSTTGVIVGGYLIQVWGEAVLYRCAAMMVTIGLFAFLAGNGQWRCSGRPLVEFQAFESTGSCG